MTGRRGRTGKKEREILHCVSFVGFVQNDRPPRENRGKEAARLAHHSIRKKH